MQVILKKYNIIVILGFFVLLYNPPLLTFNTMHIVGLISLLYIFFNRKYLIDNGYYKWILYFFLIFIYICMSVGVNGSNFGYILYPIYYFIDVIPFSCSLNVYKRKNNISNDDIWSMVFTASLMQSVLSVISFLNDDIQHLFVDKIIAYGGIESYSYWSTLRMYGFSNGLMFEMPVIQSVLAIFALYYSSQKGKRYILLSGILFFSAVINARVSFIILLIGILTIVVLSKQKYSKKIGIIICTLIMLIAFQTVLMPYIKDNSPLTYKWITEGMEDISNFFHGDISDGYFSYLSNKNKYQLPKSTLGLFFGKGILVLGGNNTYNVSSDIGFVNDVWLGGITYVLIEYISYFILIKSLIKRNEEISSFLGLLLIILSFVLNFKGCIFSMNSFMNFAVISHILLKNKVDISSKDSEVLN